MVRSLFLSSRVYCNTLPVLLMRGCDLVDDADAVDPLLRPMPSPGPLPPPHGERKAFSHTRRTSPGQLPQRPAQTSSQ
jgi:hypothetical protein